VGTRRWILSAAGVGLLACVAVAVFVGTSSDGHTARKAIVCAGVGLNGPSAPTPEAALAAYLQQGGRSASGWRRVGHSVAKNGHESTALTVESYSFMPQHAQGRMNFTRIIVSDRYGTWSADGAC
jgi:hypothetical protein